MVQEQRGRRERDQRSHGMELHYERLRDGRRGLLHCGHAAFKRLQGHGEGDSEDTGRPGDGGQRGPQRHLLRRPGCADSPHDGRS